MCTVVISLAPDERVPLLLLGVRDEFTGRPWQAPARHWPGSPLIGGRDLQAGGTWLAAHPGIPRVACILNGRGQAAPPATRRSRGGLPLRAATEGAGALKDLLANPNELASYDPFHLVCADLTAATLLSWDGAHAAHTELRPATHLLTNAGHAYPPGQASTPPGQPSAPPGQPSAPPGQASTPDPKAAYFGPKFAAYRPSGNPGAGSIREAWGDWLTLAAGGGLPLTDPAAIIARREVPDGRLWGSTSVTLVALAGDGALRYDFQPDPTDPAAWYSVATG
jgi:hypothetical protein